MSLLQAILISSASFRLARVSRYCWTLSPPCAVGAESSADSGTMTTPKNKRNEPSHDCLNRVAVRVPRPTESPPAARHPNPPSWHSRNDLNSSSASSHGRPLPHRGGGDTNMWHGGRGWGGRGGRRGGGDRSGRDRQAWWDPHHHHHQHHQQQQQHRPSPVGLSESNTWRNGTTPQPSPPSTPSRRGGSPTSGISVRGRGRGRGRGGRSNRPDGRERSASGGSDHGRSGVQDSTSPSAPSSSHGRGAGSTSGSNAHSSSGRNSADARGDSPQHGVAVKRPAPDSDVQSADRPVRPRSSDSSRPGGVYPEGNRGGGSTNTIERLSEDDVLESSRATELDPDEVSLCDESAFGVSSGGAGSEGAQSKGKKIRQKKTKDQRTAERRRDAKLQVRPAGRVRLARTQQPFTSRRRTTRERTPSQAFL